MKKNIKSRLALILVFIMMLSMILNVISFAETKVNLHIHKLQHKEAIGTPEKPKIENTGEEITIPNYLEKYDKNKYGDVGFSLYKFISREKAVEYMANINANDPYNIDHTTDPNFDHNFKITRDVDDLGEILINDLVEGYYLLVETKTPDGMIAQKAEPLMLSLPQHNAHGIISTQHIYPKNHVQSLTISFTKLAENQGLKNAKFDLYKGVPGSGTLQTSDIMTNDQGKIDITNILVGKYYLVEKESLQVGPGKRYALSELAKNDVNNKLTFNISANGTTSDALIAVLKNHQNPKIGKILLTTPLAGEAATFKTRILIPEDIANVPDTVVVGGQNKVLDENIYTVFKYIDKFSNKLENKGLDLRVYAGEQELEKDVDYKLNETDGKFELDFITKDSGPCRVSDKIKNNAGKQIIVMYKLYVKPDVVSGDILTNDASLEFKRNNTSGTVTTENPGDNKYEELKNEDPDANKPDDNFPPDPNHPGQPNNPHKDPDDVPKNPDDDGSGTVKIGFYKLKVITKEKGVTLPKKLNAKLHFARKVGGVLQYKKDGGTGWTENIDEAKKYDTIDGEIEFDGLGMGKHYIIEAEAPAGYKKNDPAVHEVVITNKNETLEIKFSPIDGLPLTGGDKIIVISFIGIMIITTGIILNKKKTKNVVY